MPTLADILTPVPSPLYKEGAVGMAQHPSPRVQTFPQWLAERGTPYLEDTEFGLESPWGDISERGKKAIKARLDERLRMMHLAWAEFQALVDSGEVVDPSSRFIPTKLPTGPSPEKLRLLRQAKELHELAARGMKPLAYKKAADTLERQAAGMAQHPDMARIGPQAWAELHAWAERLRAQVGDSCGCGEFAVMGARAFHDLVNAKLGKPVKYGDDLKRMAEEYAKAAGVIGAKQEEEEEYESLEPRRPDPTVQPSLFQEHSGEPKMATKVPPGRMVITQRVAKRESYDVLSPSGNTYVVRYEGSGDADPEYVGLWSCSCPAYKFAKRGAGVCKHIQAVLTFKEMIEADIDPDTGQLRLSQSFLDTIVNSALATATSIGVAKALSASVVPGGVSPDPSNKEEDDKPKEKVMPPVIDVDHVQGDQAQVEGMSGLLTEIDKLLQDKASLGEVDADRLEVTRQ